MQIRHKIIAFLFHTFNQTKNHSFLQQPKKMLAQLVSKHKIKLAKWHINFGDVDINAKDDKNTSAIIYASEFGYYEIVELLLANGASALDTTDFGTTPLHNACIDGHIDIAKLLIKHGADVLARDFDGFDALVMATRYGHAELVDYLLTIGADANYEITHTNKIHGGFTPLMVAVSTTYANLEIVKLLINVYRVDINHKSALGSTALQLAVVWNKKSIVELLLENGADPNLKNKIGSTALITAVVNYHPDIVDLLIQYGARVNEKNNVGRTALLNTVVYQKDKAAWITVVQLLLAGADPNVEDFEGKSAIQITKSPAVKEVFERWLITKQMIVLNELKVDWCVDCDFWSDLKDYADLS
jgi:ankyrin repeat protein